MDLSPTTTTTTLVREKPWLASAHGTDCPITVTLDVGGSTFDSIRVNNGDGTYTIPSGVALVKGAGTLYQRVDGDDVARGHLLEEVRFKAGSTKAGASLLWHGLIVQAKVPASTAGAFANANRAPGCEYV